MEINYCDHTGLLYVNEVAFTKERIEKIKNIIDYGNKNHNQFDYSVCVNDQINEDSVVVDIEVMALIEEYIEDIGKDGLTIASDEDFN